MLIYYITIVVCSVALCVWGAWSVYIRVMKRRILAILSLLYMHHRLSGRDMVRLSHGRLHWESIDGTLRAIERRGVVTRDLHMWSLTPEGERVAERLLECG